MQEDIDRPERVGVFVSVDGEIYGSLRLLFRKCEKCNTAEYYKQVQHGHSASSLKEATESEYLRGYLKGGVGNGQGNTSSEYSRRIARGAHTYSIPKKKPSQDG